ncbi:LD-carboxypeptidase [bacterium 210820-DFI.6.37]|nr:LD-carboxypeptidase [bacterium 210820-DFI.6.37]
MRGFIPSFRPVSGAGLKRPAPLKKGDRAAIIAPASPVPKAVLDTAVQSIKFLDLVPVVMPGCALSSGYLAGPDPVRARDLNQAFADPSISGIFCLRGGYGTPRLLPLLDFKTIQKNPKRFIGYSDITALHTAFNQICGFMTFHGPMPSADYRKLDPFSLGSLKHSLFASSLSGFLKNPSGESFQVLYPGKARGILTGGNLSMLAATLGSPYEIDARGKILFIEEVSEPLYRVDRCLTALNLAGKFRDCAGVILGTFTDCQGASDSLTPEEIFQEITAPWRKPAIANFRAGHVDSQSTVALGMEIQFNTDTLKPLVRP